MQRTLGQSVDFEEPHVNLFGSVRAKPDLQNRFSLWYIEHRSYSNSSLVCRSWLSAAWHSISIRRICLELLLMLRQVLEKTEIYGSVSSELRMKELSWPFSLLSRVNYCCSFPLDAFACTSISCFSRSSSCIVYATLRNYFIRSSKFMTLHMKPYWKVHAWPVLRSSEPT
jgi:hypothetical protein